ncbi:MAG: flagellar motor switch protein FliM [Anaerolineae bacterium]
MMTEESYKLSQQEIDALFEMLPQAPEEQPALSEGKKRDVQLYDFRSPAKYSKGHIWTLQMVHENLAKRLTSSLSIYLRSRVQVTLTALDQGTYAVFVAEMPNPAVTHIISIHPLPGRIVLGLDPDLATAIIDRMLGGAGLNRGRSREMTEMELTLIHKAVEKVLIELRRAWEDIIELEPIIEAVVLNPLFAGVAFPTDSALLAMYDVFFQEISGTMSITIPFSVLDPIASKLTSGAWGGRLTRRANGAGNELARRMAAHLSQTNIPVSVRLITSQLSLNGIAGLQAGEVLLLDTYRDGLARVLVGGQQKFWGRPGVLDGRMAVQIERAIESRPPGLPVSGDADDERMTNGEQQTRHPESFDPSTGPGADQASGQAPSAEHRPGTGLGADDRSDLHSLDTVESELPGNSDEQ